MHKELLTLRSRIFVRPGSGGIDPSSVSAFNTEIGLLGYTFDGKALAALRSLDVAGFSEVRKRTLDLLQVVTGAVSSHHTLFAKFPYKTPNQHEYLKKRISGYIWNELNFNIKDGRVLSCGHIIDPKLFDLEEFGACPICQFEVDEIAYHEEAKYAFKRLTPLKLLSTANDTYLVEAASNLLARPSSLSGEERTLLLALKGAAIPRCLSQVARETLPFVYAFFGPNTVVEHLAGATDVLRIAVFLSAPEADLSLAKPIRCSTGSKTSKKICCATANRGCGSVRS